MFLKIRYNYLMTCTLIYIIKISYVLKNYYLFIYIIWISIIRQDFERSDFYYPGILKS